jgi:hypothetical protein
MRRNLALFTILLIALVVGASVVFAGTATVNGTIDSGDPTMPVVFISAPNCTGQGASLVLYEALPFTVDVAGDYSFSLLSDGGFASLYLMDSGFNPPAAFPNCLAGDNSGNPVTFTETLAAGVTYYAVPFDDTFDQLGGNYTLTVTGPGTASLGSANCPYPLPAGSVVYNIPAGAPTFYDPDLGAQTNFDLPAGTWYISEFTGDFALVWISCEGSPVYVPANAVAR